MTTAILVPTLTFKSWTNNGQPNAFGTLTSYQAGTSTPLVTWTDSTATINNANPLTLNSRGEANVFLLPNIAYKFIEADSSGNIFKTTDQVVNSVLITLFGGTDTGSANAYVLTFTANFTAYQDGIVIYFIPANANTGASTINVNGLGVISIINSDGSPLTANEIVANQPATIIYKGGNFIWMTPPIITQGSFTAQLTGFAASINQTVKWYRTGNKVVLNFPTAVQGTSTTTAMTLTGVPLSLSPATIVLQECFLTLVDNSAPVLAKALISRFSTTISFVLGAAGGPFTAVGNKGTINGGSMAYDIS